MANGGIKVESRGRRQRFRFYVCPKAATLSDDQPFPIGTAFVVETYRMEAADEPLVSRFVMEKYAGVTTGELDRVHIRGLGLCDLWAGR